MLRNVAVRFGNFVSDISPPSDHNRWSMAFSDEVWNNASGNRVAFRAKNDGRDAVFVMQSKDRIEVQAISDNDKVCVAGIKADECKRFSCPSSSWIEYSRIMLAHSVNKRLVTIDRRIHDNCPFISIHGLIGFNSHLKNRMVPNPRRQPA